jgi:Amt family ammonium transporter
MEQVQLLTLWLPLLAAGTLLIRAGQALAAVGTARAKNAASAAARHLCDLSVTSLAFSLIGVHLLTKGTTARFIGNDSDIPINFDALTLHFAAIVLIASGLIAPAVAGRSKWILPLFGSLLISLFLFPLLGRWVFFGWLHSAGLIDIGGALPIHLAGALCGAVAVYWVGPRTGKYNHDGSTSIIPPHQPALPAIGTLFMIVGWLPYVMGSTLLQATGDRASAMAEAALNAIIAAAAGGLGAMIITRLRFAQDDLSALYTGLLAGAVSITAACGTIAPWQASLLGLIAGLLTPIASQWLDFKCRLDDPGELIAPHAVGAIVATLGAALFYSSSFSGKVRAIGVGCLAIGIVAMITILLSALVFATLNRVAGLRVSEGDEFDGLDLAQHDLNAYPDFQQTTIKSYHLREA